MTELPDVFMFGPFTFDPAAGRLWRGAQTVPLRPTAAALLQYFLRHPNRVLSKAELLEAVWSKTHTTGGVLRVTVHALRQALDERAQAPQFLETVGRQGYRWRDETATGVGALGVSAPSNGGLVDRQQELARLHQAWARGLSGERQLVLVEGEAGIGKTVLVEAFVARLRAGGAVRVGWGQCLELYGAEEPYRPLLEVFDQLGRSPDGTRTRELLQQEAPQWLAQLPGLVADEAAWRVLRWRVQAQGRVPKARSPTRCRVSYAS